MLRSGLPRIALATAVLGAALASCGESPFEPRGEGERIPLGQVIEDDVSGDTVRSYSFVASVRLLANPVPAGKMITPQVVDPSTGAVLAGAMSLTAPSQEFSSPGPFVVPASGTFLIRVRGGSAFSPDDATAPFEFYVRRGF